jgi:hypothetical protein
MEKLTLRRIGWVGASLGLTSVLVGCNDVQSDTEVSGGAPTSGYLDESNGITDVNGLNGSNGLNSTNGLNIQNGLNITNGFNITNGLNTNNGLGTINGFNATNGFNGANGFNTLNGFNGTNGFNVTNGLNIANGLNTTNGLFSNAGYMTNEHGRMVVQYLARCALASGDSLVKPDQNGTNFTFAGAMGLAPEYKTAGCNKDCAEKVSACMMAHINSSGTHIPLWMTTPDMGTTGWGTSPSFPTREGTFFGQLMVVNQYYAQDAYYCNGPGADQNMVPGRLGDTTATTYVNAWPKSAGMDGLCETNHVTNYPTANYDHGKCVAHTTNGVVDGDSSCTLNGTVYNHPLTVWRGATYQAETATGGGFDSSGVWADGRYGFVTNCSVGSSGCAIIADTNNGMGKRVGYIGPSKGVKFTNVTAAATTSNIIVYYTLGDAYNLFRNLQFKVNGSAAQIKSFGGLQDWSHPRGAAITLTGFNVGSNNTIYVTGDPNMSAPDLDWIEVLGTSSSLPNAGFCTPSKWTVTAGKNGSSAPNAVNGNGTDRWTTGSAQAVGDYYQIDFGGMVKLSALQLDNSQSSSSDYADSVGVFTSQDGTTFSNVAAKVSTGGSKTVFQMTQESVRAIRIKIVGTSRTNYWSIPELSIINDVNGKAGCQL